MRKPTSKDRRHTIRKRMLLKKHKQSGAIILGRGLDPAWMVPTDANLLRATPEGIFIY